MLRAKNGWIYFGGINGFNAFDPRDLVDSDFEWVSADLIFGLPGQTAGQWRDGLDVAIASGVDHLSCYQLTIHEGTVFGRRAARGRLREAPDDAQSELFGVADRILVMFEGELVGELAGAEATEEAIGLLMAGCSS